MPLFPVSKRVSGVASISHVDCELLPDIPKAEYAYLYAHTSFAILDLNTPLGGCL